MAEWKRLESVGAFPKVPYPPVGKPKSPPPDGPNKKPRISSTRKDSGGHRPKAGIKETDAEEPEADAEEPEADAAEKLEADAAEKLEPCQDSHVMPRVSWSQIPWP